MLKIKIANEEGKNAKWFDLMNEIEVTKAHEHAEALFYNEDNYIISEIVSDWARFDNYTALDDMVETVTVIKSMIDDEVELFKLIYKDGVHEPIDIAKNVRYNEMKYIEDTCEDDEIWETVYFEKEDKEIAIMH